MRLATYSNASINRSYLKQEVCRAYTAVCVKITPWLLAVGHHSGNLKVMGYTIQQIVVKLYKLLIESPNYFVIFYSYLERRAFSNSIFSFLDLSLDLSHCSLVSCSLFVAPSNLNDLHYAVNEPCFVRQTLLSTPGIR
jgi:hypothetical protein